MTDFLVGVALSNLVVSGVVALAAYLVHRQGRYPVLAHLLWVLVLVKLVTPPLLTLPVAALPSSIAGAAASSAAVPAWFDGAAAMALPALLLAWATGSIVVLTVSLWRIRRFDGLLRSTSIPAPFAVQYLADSLTRPLGLRSAPTIELSSTRISPLTWWTGGRVRIVIPRGLPDEVDAEGLRWVLAHELAHVKRRDYLVRWLEWMACVAFWWNPVVWMTRRYLHDDEEASCDAYVVDRLDVQPRSYATALLNVVEFLSGGTDRPPAVATGIDGGGKLERRLRLIVASGRIKAAPRWLVAGVLGMAVMVAPLGFGASAAIDPVDTLPVSGGDSFPAAPSVAQPFTTVSATSDDRGATALLSAAVSPTATNKVKRARIRARRSVRRAIDAGIAIDADSDRSERRAARSAIRKAADRLDRAVNKGVISRPGAKALKQSLRALLRPSVIDAPPDLGDAVAARVLSQKNATRLLDALATP